MVRRMSLIAKKLLIFLVLSTLILAGATPTFGQAAPQQVPEAVSAKPQPPMKNVFLNVLWGSLCGGFVVMGWSTLDDSIDEDDRYSFSRMSEQFLVGATYGGILGVGAGVYFSIRGITFDENRSRIAFYNDFSGDQAGRQFFAASRASRDKNAVDLLNFHFKF